MSVGFIMMCHTALGRAAEVARHWASRDCPVVLHVDARVKRASFDRLVSDLADLENVRFSKRYTCEWGTWGLVQATLVASEVMLRSFPGLGHVFLVSGSCLPLRPVADLVAHLDWHPTTDFIESVTTEEVGWTIGGLDIERFTLRFPFSWRKQRRLFDFYVRLQRKIGLRRRIPPGVVPHLGSQWWCLTRKTLAEILGDPDREDYDTYFRRVWIPDESYFQTLARKHSTQIESRSLTLSKFDFQGKPHIFYDDHLQLLRRSDSFVARKIWPNADKLYRTFLSGDAASLPIGEANSGKVDRLFAKAVERRTKGRTGLYMQGRYPNASWENGKTAAAYSVFQGFTELFDDFELWLAKVTSARVHGHLFAKDRVEFAGDDKTFSGGLPDSAAMRDYNPKSFLTSLIWNTRGERQCFQYSPKDLQSIMGFVATDANAQISVISGAWAVPLFHSNRSVTDLRKEAAQLQRIEVEQLKMLREAWVKARVRVWTMAEFVDGPMESLQTIIDEISPRAMRRLVEAPRIRDLSGFGQFLQSLRNQGMQPTLMGEFPVTDEQRPTAARRARPYLVK